MTSIRKLIDKISGREAGIEGELEVRAFGKLPSSREYLYLNAGEGPAKVFVDWIKAGHDDWIRRTDKAVRGKIVPTSFWVQLPEWDDCAALGCIWPSHDGTSSPRAFPFSLFTLARLSPQKSPLMQFLWCEHVWSQLRAWFGPLYKGQMMLADLQARPLTPLTESDTARDHVVRESRGISLKLWLEAILPATGCRDAQEYYSHLHSRLAGWHKHGHTQGFTDRMQLSPSLPCKPQIAAWLNWLEVNLGKLDRPLTGLWTQINTPRIDPSVVVMFRPLLLEDFQFTTVNALSDFPLDEGAPTQESRPIVDRGTPSSSTPQGQQSLWDWSSAAMT